MFLQHFANFRYHSNHNFHLTTKKNDVHNQHIAICSHTKFQEVSSKRFRVISGSICFYIILTIFRYHSNLFYGEKKNDVHNQHIATYLHIKFHERSSNRFWVIAGSRFQWTNIRTDRQTDGGQTYSPPPVFHIGRGLISRTFQMALIRTLQNSLSFVLLAMYIC